MSDSTATKILTGVWAALGAAIVAGIIQAVSFGIQVSQYIATSNSQRDEQHQLNIQQAKTNQDITTLSKNQHEWNVLIGEKLHLDGHQAP